MVLVLVAMTFELLPCYIYGRPDPNDVHFFRPQSARIHKACADLMCDASHKINPINIVGVNICEQIVVWPLSNRRK